MSERQRHIFTSESVTEGHPDKIADQISDAVLDAVLEQDPYGRVACETLVTTGICMVAGEITTKCYVDVPRIARETIEYVGYTDAAFRVRFEDLRRAERDPDAVAGYRHGRGSGRRRRPGHDVRLRLRRNAGADADAHHAGAQAGAASVERRPPGRTLDFLRPDGKSQVSVEYVNGKPVRIDAVVISTQHSDKVSIETLRAEVRKHIIDPILPAGMVDSGTKYHINPTGRFVVGGPHGDTGLTGRKIIVDTYGGMGRHGGGAFSGKDPTKVDRSACYMARYIAKNIVAAGLATRCEVQLAYAIGVAEPVSVLVNTFGTGVIEESRITTLVRAVFKLTPQAIIKHLNLRRPIYRKTAAFGHFGRTEESFTWEATDKAAELRQGAPVAEAVAQ